MATPAKSLCMRQAQLLCIVLFASCLSRGWCWSDSTAGAANTASTAAAAGSTVGLALKASYNGASSGAVDAATKDSSSVKPLERSHDAALKPYDATAAATAANTVSIPQLTVVLVTMFDHLPRALAALAAAYKNLDPALVREYIVVCPQAEATVLRRTLKAPDADGTSRSPPLRVLSDQQALGLTLAETQAVPFCGYRTQMAVKLTVSAHVATEHYLVLDSDVLLVRPLNASVAHWIYPQPGKAVYKPDIRRRHARWWRNSETTLQLSGCIPDMPEIEVSGVTPAILNTGVARAVVGRWAELFGGRKQGVQTILSKRGPFWTEYTSYHVMACHMGGFEKYHSKPLPGAPALYQGYWQRKTARGGIELCDKCLFMVVQDHIDVNIRDVVKSLDTLFDPAAVE